MPIVYRDVKGSALTAAELDQNFRDLDSRLKTLEKNFASASFASVEKIVLSGADLEFLTGTGKSIGQVRLPVPKFNPTGIWRAAKDYAAYDICVVAGKSYCCVKPHKSSADFVKDISNWELIFSSR